MSDVIEIQNCPICGQGLNTNAPDSVDYNGQLIHAHCVASAEAQIVDPPKGYSPNNSYT